MPTKLTNRTGRWEEVPMTDQEIADIEAANEHRDLDIEPVRQERNGLLAQSDWTQLGDAALGDHTAEEWTTYRQALRDLPSVFTRVSEVVWPNDPPTQAAIDAAAE
jgi:hypothetical protein